MNVALFIFLLKCLLHQAVWATEFPFEDMISSRDIFRTFQSQLEKRAHAADMSGRFFPFWSADFVFATTKQNAALMSLVAQ